MTFLEALVWIAGITCIGFPLVIGGIVVAITFLLYLEGRPGPTVRK